MPEVLVCCKFCKIDIHHLFLFNSELLASEMPARDENVV